MVDANRYSNSTALWAAAEFRQAALGDKRRTKRLISIACELAERPGGRVSEVFLDGASREAAYRFLENGAVDVEPLTRAAADAALRRAAGDEFVFVPVDQTSLSVRDPGNLRGLGPVGARRRRGRGLEVMNAVAVRADGTPLGICAQRWWMRSEKRAARHRNGRGLADKETIHWLEAISDVRASWQRTEVKCRPWYQLDRGGDFRELLHWASTADEWVTVRAAQNRRLAGRSTRRLWSVLAVAPRMGIQRIEVSPRPNRKARRARMEIRAKPVTLRLRNRWWKSQPVQWVKLTAVLVRERGTTPHGEKPIEWLLLTNRPVTSRSHALLVVFGYSQRWRIEQFHKTWKSVCRVEQTQLRSPGAIKRWATIQASVAMRIERLTYLARTSPATPATDELGQNEVDAILLLHSPRRYQEGYSPTIAEAVRWIAELGGYTGKSSGGPPGSIVIQRGLQRVEPVALALRNQATHSRCRDDGRKK